MDTEIVFDDLDVKPEDSTPARNVARGVALLDKRRPGWAQEIDTDNLNLKSPNLCILGQLYGGHYMNGCEVLDIGLLEPFGFCPYGDDEAQTLAEWKRVIAERVN